MTFCTIFSQNIQKWKKLTLLVLKDLDFSFSNENSFALIQKILFPKYLFKENYFFWGNPVYNEAIVIYLCYQMNGLLII